MCKDKHKPGKKKRKKRRAVASEPKDEDVDEDDGELMKFISSCASSSGARDHQHNLEEKAAEAAKQPIDPRRGALKAGIKKKPAAAAPEGTSTRHGHLFLCASCALSTFGACGLDVLAQEGTTERRTRQGSKDKERGKQREAER